MDWLLDPEVTYLNQGGYGCPRRVFERYLAWQRELEREPTDLFYRRLPDLLADVREPLAVFLGAHARRTSRSPATPRRRMSGHYGGGGRVRRDRSAGAAAIHA